MTWSLSSSVLSTSNKKTILAGTERLGAFLFHELTDEPLMSLAAVKPGPKAISALECVKLRRRTSVSLKRKLPASHDEIARWAMRQQIVDNRIHRSMGSRRKGLGSETICAVYAVELLPYCHSAICHNPISNRRTLFRNSERKIPRVRKHLVYWAYGLFYCSRTTWAGPPFVTDDPEPVAYQHWNCIWPRSTPKRPTAGRELRRTSS